MNYQTKSNYQCAGRPDSLTQACLRSVRVATYGFVLSLLVAGACGQEKHNGTMGDGMQGTGMTDDMTKMSSMMMKHLGAADANYDARFIAMMIPHHESAVMMAKDALSNASRPELKALAQSMIASQQQEVATMKQWQSSWAGGAMPGMGGHGMAMDDDMMAKMGARMTAGLAPKDAGYEDRFIDMMIPHHQSAIDMAKDALGKSNHAELKELARSIITEQEKEIAQMIAWRKQWYGH